MVISDSESHLDDIMGHEAVSAGLARNSYASQTVSSGPPAVIKPHRTQRRNYAEEDRKQKSRERNRIHARKTRERKKLHISMLQDQICELRQEEIYLKQLSEDHNTSLILLGLASPSLPPTEPPSDYAVQVQPPPHISNLLQEVSGEIERHNIERLEHVNASKLASHSGGGNDWIACATQHFTSLQSVIEQLEDVDTAAAAYVQAEEEDGSEPMHGKKQCKYSPMERARIRKERNRMHAKKTRDRKKLFLEASQLIINSMELENSKKREELRACGALPADYVTPRDRAIAAVLHNYSDEREEERRERSHTDEHTYTTEETDTSDADSRRPAKRARASGSTETVSSPRVQTSSHTARVSGNSETVSSPRVATSSYTEIAAGINDVALVANALLGFFAQTN